MIKCDAQCVPFICVYKNKSADEKHAKMCSDIQNATFVLIIVVSF